jgi:hypothetical protein
MPNKDSTRASVPDRSVNIPIAINAETLWRLPQIGSAQCDDYGTAPQNNLGVAHTTRRRHASAIAYF